jgi:signal peptidase II
MLKNNRYYKISSLIILSIFFDQFSKFWIRNNIESYNEIELIGSFFTLIRVENSGAFLGMGSELSYIPKLILLIIFPILVLVAVSIYTYVDKKLDNLSLVGFSLIIGGGLANIFDRIVYGSVTDFLYINLGFFKTGIFNIADLSVTTGMILILIASFKKGN